MQRSDDEKWLDLYESLPSFVHESQAMQRFYPYGDRKQYADLTNEEWAGVSYDSFQDCLTCDMRHRCGLTLSRDHYRKSTDLIVCSHDFYMEHVWTEESRKGKDSCRFCRITAPSCLMKDICWNSPRKSVNLSREAVDARAVLERLLQNDIREEFAELIEDALAANDEFFYVLSEESKEIAGSHRLDIQNDQRVKRAADELCRLLDKIGEALVFESEMYTIDKYELSVVEEYVEQMAYSLSLYQKDAISWLETRDTDSTFVVMPRTVAEVLGEKVFSKRFLISSHRPLFLRAVHLIISLTASESVILYHSPLNLRTITRSKCLLRFTVT